MRTSTCLGQKNRATEAKRLGTRAPLEILIATLIKTSSQATFGTANTTISSSEDGFPDTKTMGAGVLVMATQMMMTTLITDLKNQQRHIRDDPEKISREATTIEIMASSNQAQDVCSVESKRLSARRQQMHASGLNWKKYTTHPEGYKTCWNCKNNHVSVTSKSMALKKFAKKLDFKRKSTRTGIETIPFSSLSI
jgi:hypothetical protein